MRFILLFSFLIQMLFASHTLVLKPKMMKLSLPATTSIQMDKITCTIPKGWSILGEENSQLKGFISTPSVNIELDDTSFGIHYKTLFKKMPIEQIEANMLKNMPNRSTKFVQWNGQRWLLIQYTNTNGSGKPLAGWVGIFIKDNIQYILTAMTLQTEQKKFEPIFIKMFESIHIK